MAGRLDEPGLSGTVSGMSPETFLAECQNTEIHELAASLGGWPAVLSGWRAQGAQAAQFADVWEMTDFLFSTSGLLADRMAIDESVVVEFASTVHANLVLGDMAIAQDLLASFCSDMAEAYEGFAAENAKDTDAAQLGAFWRSWSDGFAARAPRVVSTSIV